MGISGIQKAFGFSALSSSSHSALYRNVKFCSQHKLRMLILQMYLLWRIELVSSVFSEMLIEQILSTAIATSIEHWPPYLLSRYIFIKFLQPFLALSLFESPAKFICKEKLVFKASVKDCF